MRLQQSSDEDNTPKSYGRTKISSNKRDNSFSKRAAQGDLVVETDKRCPYCGHHKSLVNQAPNSPVWGRRRCSKCKRTIKK